MSTGSGERWGSATPSEIWSFKAILRPRLWLEPAVCALHFFDDLNLGAIGSLQETNPSAVVIRRHLLENADPVGLELSQCARIVVGVDGDVLDAVKLLAALTTDYSGDVELQAMQVEPAAASGNLGNQFRAQIVYVELRGLLGILTL